MHGGVVPWWRTARSSRRASRRARARPPPSSATTSACRPPASVVPSPTTSPSRTTTAPTVGFGYARSRPRARELDRARKRHASACTRRAVGARQVVAAEDRRRRRRAASRPARAARAMCVVDAAVDLDVHAGGQQPRAGARRGRTPPPGTAGPSSPGGCSCRGRDRRRRATAATSSGSVSGLNATPTCSSCSRAARIVAAHVVDRLVVERDAVAAGLRDRLEVLRRALDHQVHVDRAAERVDERRDRLQHDRPHRDRLDEVAVADVEVEDAAAGDEQASICSPSCEKSAP